MSGTEDHRGQDDDEQQPGQGIGQHVYHEAGSGRSVRHGAEPTDGAYIHFKEVFAWRICS
jgi:hypothetical protein